MGGRGEAPGPPRRILSPLPNVFAASEAGGRSDCRVDMTRARNGVLHELQQSRPQFLALVAEIRPELHRYCARMTGSIADGEDVVQDTLARAYYDLADLKEMPTLRPWLFRIAHNRAIDF